MGKQIDLFSSSDKIERAPTPAELASTATGRKHGLDVFVASNPDILSSARLFGCWLADATADAAEGLSEVECEGLPAWWTCPWLNEVSPTGNGAETFLLAIGNEILRQLPVIPQLGWRWQVDVAAASWWTRRCEDKKVEMQHMVSIVASTEGKNDAINVYDREACGLW